MKNPKAKGSRVERGIKKLFEEAGFQVVRSAGSLGVADLLAQRGPLVLNLQVKARKTFSLYSWFAENLQEPDALVLKANYRPPLIVMPLGKFLEIVKNFENFQK